MADQKDSYRKPRPWLAAIWVVLVLITMALAYSGWLVRTASQNHLHGLRASENAAFMTLHAFGFDDAYAHLDEPGDDWQLIAARWLGLLLFISAAAAASIALFESQIASLRLAFSRRHTLIIGDHDMAYALIRDAKRRGLFTLHVSDAATRMGWRGRLVTVPRTAGEDPMIVGRAAQSRRVVIAETDLGASAEHALRMRDRLQALAAEGPSVAVHLDDPATAELIHHVEGGVDLYAFSEAQSAARAVLSQHPPYLLARRVEAASVHVLIVGFGWLGQAIARDIVLNSLVADLGRPWITVIDPDPSAAAEFLHRHPEFPEICDFEMVHDLAAARVSGAADPPPPAVCAAYVCLRESAGVLAVAVALRERATRHDLIQGPIFVRLRSGGLMLAPGGIAALRPLHLYSFASLSAAAAQSCALVDDPDAGARAVHEGYSRIGGGTAKSWSALTEEMRISNRRVVNHVAAKLASLGFDLEPWLETPEAERDWPIAIDPDAPLFRDEADRHTMARLEHRRWMADRQLNGWRWGKTRDDARKIHPDLVPFEDLSDDIKAYDYAIGDWLDGFLPRKAGGLKRRV